MREFTDEGGTGWVASVAERPGDDYKGRFFFLIAPSEGGAEEAVSLEDVRWNSSRTAERTLKTMSDLELRRRLRSARGRS